MDTDALGHRSTPTGDPVLARTPDGLSDRGGGVAPDGARPDSARWFSTRRGRIRVEAYVVVGSLVTLVGPATAFFNASEVVGLVLAGAAATTMLLALAAIFMDTLLIRPQSGEEDEAERAVARLVSGGGSTPSSGQASGGRIAVMTSGIPTTGPADDADEVDATADSVTGLPSGSNSLPPAEGLGDAGEVARSHRQTRRSPRPLEQSSFIRPTSAEREALPISSLPFDWLQITASLPRQGALPYLDGMSMLLELALLGLVDVPPTPRRGRPRSGSALVVGSDASHNAALAGALERIRAFGSPLEAQSAAIRLAPYVAALANHTVGAKEGRARVREAIVGDGETDIRTALLVWMLKQDCAVGGSTTAAVFPKGTGVTHRALRRAGPDFYALADHTVAAAVHRVLFALFVLPHPGGMA